jgi:hypothetical protein
MYPRTVTFALAMALALPVAAAQDYEFSFWPLEGATTDRRFVELLEGACGPVAVARVKKLPDLGDKAFESEVVFELTNQSRIARRWYLPVNALPIAVEGAKLVFRDGQKIYKTTTAGAILAVESLPPIPEVTEAKCKMPKVFEGSEYARCWAVPRIGMKATTVLALQGPCT